MRLPPLNSVTGLPQWKQSNRSDINGSLRGTFNVDLTKNAPFVRATRMLQTTSQGGINGVTANSTITDVPVGFIWHVNGNKLWTVAGSFAHVTAGSTGTTITPFAQDTTTGTPVDCDSSKSFIKAFNLGIAITANNKLYYRTSGNWTATSISTASDGPYPLEVFQGRLYYGYGGSAPGIGSTSDGTTLVVPSNTYAVALPTTHFPLFLKASRNTMWIGVEDAEFQKGYVHEWDGASTQVTRSWPLDTWGALAGVVLEDVLYIVDAKARLLQFTPSGFKEIDRFPVNEKFLTGASNTYNTKFIHPNGMEIVDGKIRILIDPLVLDSAGSIEEFCPAGIWEYDPAIGLYHKESLSYTPVGTTTVYDYGQNRVSAVGGLDIINRLSAAAGATGKYLAGATIYTSAAATDAGIFTNETFDTTALSTYRGAYFVTGKIFGGNAKENWQKVYTANKKLFDSANKIVVKYIMVDQKPTEYTITWASTTTFTYTASTIAYEKGDEVEITQGTAGGLCAHITDVHFTGSTTVQVTIDETFANATGTSKARFQKWKKLPAVLNTQSEDRKEMPVGVSSPWMAFKVFMIFKAEDEFQGLDIVSEFNQSLK